MPLEFRVYILLHQPRVFLFQTYYFVFCYIFFMIQRIWWKCPHISPIYNWSCYLHVLRNGEWTNIVIMFIIIINNICMRTCPKCKYIIEQYVHVHFILSVSSYIAYAVWSVLRELGIFVSADWSYILAIVLNTPYNSQTVTSNLYSNRMF